MMKNFSVICSIGKRWCESIAAALFGRLEMLGFMLFVLLVHQLTRPAQTHVHLPVQIEPAVWVVHDTITLQPEIHNNNSQVSILYSYE